jgi:hypothetical protein
LWHLWMFIPMLSHVSKPNNDQILSSASLWHFRKPSEPSLKCIHIDVQYLKHTVIIWPMAWENAASIACHLYFASRTIGLKHPSNSKSPDPIPISFAVPPYHIEFPICPQNWDLNTMLPFEIWLLSKFRYHDNFVRFSFLLKFSLSRITFSYISPFIPFKSPFSPFFFLLLIFIQFFSFISFSSIDSIHVHPRLPHPLKFELVNR